MQLLLLQDVVTVLYSKNQAVLNNQTKTESYSLKLRQDCDSKADSIFRQKLTWLYKSCCFAASRHIHQTISIIDILLQGEHIFSQQTLLKLKKQVLQLVAKTTTYWENQYKGMEWRYEKEKRYVQDTGTKMMKLPMWNKMISCFNKEAIPDAVKILEHNWREMKG